MYSYFEWLLKDVFVKSKAANNEYNNKTTFTQKQLTYEYRNILDKVAMKMIIDEFEDERIIKALMNLARSERIIIAFNIIKEMELTEIAMLLDNNLSSIYAQKSTALKRLKDELSSIK